MRQRDALLVLFAVILAVGVSALLLAGSFAGAQPEATRPGVYFDPTRTPPPAREFVEVQRRFPGPFGAIVPLQRGVSEAASDAAGYLLVLLGTVAQGVRGPFGVPAALQIGIAAMGVVVVVAGLAALVGFAASSWRLGDVIFGAPGLRRVATEIPTPLVALLGATAIYVVWQLPIVGGIAVLCALAYSLGAVVTARLAQSAPATPTPPSVT